MNIRSGVRFFFMLFVKLLNICIMETLLFYLLEGLVSSGKIILCDEKVAGQDALRIELNCSEGHYVTSFTILRSELNCIREEYEGRKQYLSDCEIADFDKLFNALPLI